MLFSGSSHEELAKGIAKRLKRSLGKISIVSFPDGEIGVQIQENVRGKEAFVLQSVARHPNHYLMELLIIVDALKRASAKSITAVMPYFPYARQDRKDKGRVPITARLVADLLEKSGVSRVLTMDLHAEQIQGFFNIPVDNLRGSSLFVEKLSKVKGTVVVSPDVGSNRIARKFAEDLNVNLAIVDKRRVSAKKVELSALIGEVEGKVAILVDDMCSTGSTLQMAAKVCRERGAKRVIAVVTHGLFVDFKANPYLDEIWVTDTISPKEGASFGEKRVSVAPLFAEAIASIVSAKSISSLFERGKKEFLGEERS